MNAPPLRTRNDARVSVLCSPGSRLGFFAGRKLRKINLATGEILTICDAGSPGGGATRKRAGRNCFLARLGGSSAEGVGLRRTAGAIDAARSCARGRRSRLATISARRPTLHLSSDRLARLGNLRRVARLAGTDQGVEGAGPNDLSLAIHTSGYLRCPLARAVRGEVRREEARGAGRHRRK